MEPREITLLSREQKVRQGSSSKPWKRAGRWRATPVPCASESLWITAALAGTIGPRIPPTTTEAAGQPLSRAGFPAAFNPTALTSLLPGTAAGRDAQEMGCGWGKQRVNAALNPEKPLAEGGRGAAGMLWWPQPSLGSGVCVSSLNNRRRGRRARIQGK